MLKGKALLQRPHFSTFSVTTVQRWLSSHRRVCKFQATSDDPETCKRYKISYSFYSFPQSFKLQVSKPQCNLTLCSQPSLPLPSWQRQSSPRPPQSPWKGDFLFAILVATACRT